MSEHQLIWPNNVKIEVLGVSGPYSGGKTIFVLTIDPKNTLYFDFEKSGGTYESLGITRVDVPGELLKKYPNGYTPKQAFEFWYERVKAIKPGQYTVVATDPISDIEDGLVEWVKSRYKEFGFSSADKFQSTGGIFWSKVKSEWKRILADLAARCQTFAFTSHLKAVWRHGKPTTQQVPKGKATLMELSSLYLLLERTAPKDQPTPLIPSATVLKSRLSTAVLLDDGDLSIVPCLPPRLPEATPKRIREYIVTPPDYGHLDASEIEQEKELSEAEKLELEAKVAEDKRAAAEAALKAAETQQKIEDVKATALAKLRPAADKTGDTTSEVVPVAEKDEEAPAKEEQTVKDDLLEEDYVRLTLQTVWNGQARSQVNEKLKAAWKILKSRDVDVSQFKPETAVAYCRKLTQEEFSEIFR